MNNDKRNEQTKKKTTEKLNFGFQIELKEVFFCKCYYLIDKGWKCDDESN